MYFCLLDGVHITDRLCTLFLRYQRKTMVSNDLCLDDDKFVKEFAAFVSNHVLHVFSSLLLHTSSCTHLFDFLFLRQCSRANFWSLLVVPWLQSTWEKLNTISIGWFVVLLRIIWTALSRSRTYIYFCQLSCYDKAGRHCRPDDGKGRASANTVVSHHQHRPVVVVVDRFNLMGFA